MRPRFPRTSLSVLAPFFASLVVAAAGCPPAASTTCNADSDCKNGDACVEGACAPRSCTPATYCKDVDGDSFGDAHTTSDGCVETGAPSGYVSDCSDCDDTNANIHPGAPEIAADGIDQDCDGVDLCFVDADGDGHGNVAGKTTKGASLDCNQAGAHTSSVDDDCDDTDASVHPGAPEIGGDGIDQDCDGHDNCFVDVDGDGFGDGSAALVVAPDDAPACNKAGLAANGDDCDDADAAIHPGATEIVNDGIDQDCDGVDLCFADVDGDGHGDATGATAPGTSLDCSANLGTSGASNVADDCDDARADVHPGATEIPGDGVDEDCDGRELCFVDVDGDGFGSAATTTSADLTCRSDGLSATSTDCDDNNASIHPGAAEIVNDGVDQDCDGVDACFQDLDGDTFGSSVVVAGPSLHCSDGVGQGVTTNSADCDDTRADVHPGAQEIVADGVDENCDGTELCFVDADGDGLGDGKVAPTASTSIACNAPGVANNDDDCDDTVAGAAGQACSDGQACTTTDVCGQHGVCVGFDDGACNCGTDCSAANGACCDVDCGFNGCNQACVGRQCSFRCASGGCGPQCSAGASCDLHGNSSGTVGVTCNGASCFDGAQSGGGTTLDCTNDAVCVLAGATASGTMSIQCDASRCSGDGSAFGGYTATCTNGARCDLACDNNTFSCSATADASSTLVFSCAGSFTCSVTCTGGTKTSCGNGVFTCNTACP